LSDLDSDSEKRIQEIRAYLLGQLTKNPEYSLKLRNKDKTD
jgi:hypothetical protein